MEIEYVIWGIPPEKNEDDIFADSLLLTRLTSEDIARRAIVKLEELGCKKMRIQKIDTSKPVTVAEFLKECGLLKRD